MEIRDLFKEGEPLATPPVYALKSDLQAGDPEEIPVQVEHVLRVFVNEVHTMTLTCSPDHLAELVLGRLLSEGIIGSVDDVELLYVCDLGARVRVYLKDKQADFSKGERVDVATCCTDNKTLNRYFDTDKPLPELAPHQWDPAEVFALARVFAKGSPMYSVSFGAHSCMLAQHGEALYVCEDIGRHNAFDKVVGCALRDGVDLRECQVFSSGRLPVDMVSKAIRSRIPLMASKAMPTSEAVELAKQQGLVLVCGARPDKMLVYSDPAGGVASLG